MQQLELKSRVDAIRAANPAMSVRVACAQANVPHGSYLRWCREVEAGGPKARAKMGRPKKWELSEVELNCLKWFAAWSESFALAVEYFVTYGRTGTPPLPKNPHPRPGQAITGALAAEMARGGRWDARLPKSLRNAAALTEHERAMIRGEKQYNTGSLSVRRDLTIVDFDAEGIIREINMWAGCGIAAMTSARSSHSRPRAPAERPRG